MVALHPLRRLPAPLRFSRMSPSSLLRRRRQQLLPPGDPLPRPLVPPTLQRSLRPTRVVLLRLRPLHPLRRRRVVLHTLGWRRWTSTMVPCTTTQPIRLLMILPGGLCWPQFVPLDPLPTLGVNVPYHPSPIRQLDVDPRPNATPLSRTPDLLMAHPRLHLLLLVVVLPPWVQVGVGGLLWSEVSLLLPVGVEDVPHRRRVDPARLLPTTYPWLRLV